MEQNENTQSAPETEQPSYIRGMQDVIRRVGAAVSARAQEDVHPVLFVTIAVFEDEQFHIEAGGNRLPLDNSRYAADICARASMKLAANVACEELVEELKREFDSKRFHLVTTDQETLEQLRNGEQKVTFTDTTPDIDNDRD